MDPTPSNIFWGNYKWQCPRDFFNPILTTNRVKNNWKKVSNLLIASETESFATTGFVCIEVPLDVKSASLLSLVSSASPASSPRWGAKEPCSAPLETSFRMATKSASSITWNQETKTSLKLDEYWLLEYSNYICDCFGLRNCVSSYVTLNYSSLILDSKKLFRK